VVLADGEDNASKSRLDAAMRQARAADVTVYSIGVSHEYMALPSRINMATGQRTVYPSSRERTKPDSGLKTLSADTGGAFFLLRDAAEWGPTFAAVARELHSHYVLRISPGIFDGKVHSLEVKVKRAGVTARARRSYFAVSGKPR
jgi:VWFA-related protein